MLLKINIYALYIALQYYTPNKAILDVLHITSVKEILKFNSLLTVLKVINKYLSGYVSKKISNNGSRRSNVLNNNVGSGNVWNNQTLCNCILQKCNRVI